MTTLHLWVLVGNNWQYMGTRPVDRPDNINPGIFESLQGLRGQGFGQFYLLVAFGV